MKSILFVQAKMEFGGVYSLNNMRHPLYLDLLVPLENFQAEHLKGALNEFLLSLFLFFFF